MENLFINFNSEPLKALGNDRFGGYLVRFGDAANTDLTGDFFTKNTDFFVDDGASLPVLYEHGLDPVLKRRKIGKGTIKADEVGLWFETQLEKRDKYEKAIIELANKNKLGYSSGAAGHMVSRKQVGKVSEIIEWGLAEGSFVTTPAEVRNSVVALKSYADTKTFKSFEEEEEIKSKPIIKGNSLASRLTQLIEDLAEEGEERAAIIKSLAREAICEEGDVEKVLNGTTKRPSDAHLKAYARVLKISTDQLKEIAGAPSAKTIKGMFAEAVAEQTPSFWQLNDVFRNLICKIAVIAKASAATDTEFDEGGKVGEVVKEYGAAITPLILSQISEFKESSEDEFYLKLVTDLRDIFNHVKSVDLDDHSELAVSALKEIVARFKANHEARKSQKAGRVLSQRNRERLSKMLEQIQTAVSDCQVLLDESMPMASDDDMNAAKTAFLHSQWRQRQMGVDLQ